MGTKRSKVENIIKNFKTIGIENLVKASWNYKKEDDYKKDRLKANIKKNGQIENILVRLLDTGFYEVVNGNHRYDALKELGTAKVVVYDLGKITESQAVRIAIETNETKFDSDEIVMSKLIIDLEKDFGKDDLLETLPYTEDELNDILDLGNFNWEDFDKEPAEYDENDLKTIKVVVPNDTYNMWLDWKKKVKEIGDYETDSKAFEFALAEALSGSTKEV